MQNQTPNESSSMRRNVVPSQCVRVNDRGARVTVPAGGDSGEPSIELIQQNGVIQSIEVTCSCGQKISLACDYSKGS